MYVSNFRVLAQNYMIARFLGTERLGLPLEKKQQVKTKKGWNA